MGAEGSSGTPTFKQIITQKQRPNLKEGVRIGGMDSKMQNSRKNKEKKPMVPDKTYNTSEIRNKEVQNRANAKDKAAAKLKPSGNEEEQPAEDKEPNSNDKGQPEKEGETRANPNKTSTNNNACKPKKTDNLRVIINDPEIQAYR